MHTCVLICCCMLQSWGSLVAGKLNCGHHSSEVLHAVHGIISRIDAMTDADTLHVKNAMDLLIAVEHEGGLLATRLILCPMCAWATAQAKMM
jgi:hypothetical protein